MWLNVRRRPRSVNHLVEGFTGRLVACRHGRRPGTRAAAANGDADDAATATADDAETAGTAGTAEDAEDAENGLPGREVRAGGGT